MLAVLFGGYWGVKNLILSGNPIYPFRFACTGPITCPEPILHHSKWGQPFDLRILANQPLTPLVILSLLVVLWTPELRRSRVLWGAGLGIFFRSNHYYSKCSLCE